MPSDIGKRPDAYRCPDGYRIVSRPSENGQIFVAQERFIRSFLGFTLCEVWLELLGPGALSWDTTKPPVHPWLSLPEAWEYLHKVLRKRAGARTPWRVVA